MYRNGKGTFDDIIQVANLIYRYLPDSIKAYQGTLIPRHNLEIDKLWEMK